MEADIGDHDLGKHKVLDLILEGDVVIERLLICPDRCKTRFLDGRFEDLLVHLVKVYPVPIAIFLPALG
jgi:hypothetical protein